MMMRSLSWFLSGLGSDTMMVSGAVSEDVDIAVGAQRLGDPGITGTQRAKACASACARIAWAVSLSPSPSQLAALDSKPAAVFVLRGPGEGDSLGSLAVGDRVGEGLAMRSAQGARESNPSESKLFGPEGSLYRFGRPRTPRQTRAIRGRTNVR
jgi:hypothetical protein